MITPPQSRAKYMSEYRKLKKIELSKESEAPQPTSIKPASGRDPKGCVMCQLNLPTGRKAIYHSKRGKWLCAIHGDLDVIAYPDEL